MNQILVIQSIKAVLPVLLAAAAESALAATGATATVESFFNEIMTAMKASAGVVATCASLWIGYKILWGGRTVEEMVPFIIGCLVLACAPWAAETLLQ